MLALRVVLAIGDALGIRFDGKLLGDMELEIVLGWCWLHPQSNL